MEFRILGPLEVSDDGLAGGRRRESTRVARAPAPARERGRFERATARRALERGAAVVGGDGSPGARLAAPEGARRRGRPARDEAARVRTPRRARRARSRPVL